MNNGDDTAYYLHRGFRVVAIEANTHLATLAAERFGKQISSGQLRILNVGIAAQEGEQPFWICDTKSVWSSFHREYASKRNSAHHAVIVHCRRFGSILEEFGIPYYLKIDIEGNDFLCLQDLDPQQPPKFISVEGSDLDLVTQMAERGFTSFKLISQKNFLPIEFPPVPEQLRYERIEWMLQAPSRLIHIFRRLGGRAWLNRRKNRCGRPHDWTFQDDCSGPFGEELPGRWLSYDEMIATVKQAHQLNEPSIFLPLWIDFHGRS
jgi:FkbM family methyltransferase